MKFLGYKKFSWYQHNIYHYEQPITPQFTIFIPVQSSAIAFSSILPAAVALGIVLP